MGNLLPCPWCGETKIEPLDATRILGMWNIIHRCPVIGPFKIELSTREAVISIWNTRALPSATQAGGENQALRAMIRVNMLRYGPADLTHEDIDRQIEAAIAAFAPLPPAPEGGGWMPPEDRKDGYRCLGFETLWSTVEWREGYWLALTENDDRLLVTPTAFAPLPPALEGWG